MAIRTKVLAIAAVLLMLLSVMPVALCEIGTDDSSAAEASSGIPSKYDLRDTYNNVTSVKNQGNEGLCWAFSTTAALEGELINRGYDVSSTALSPLFEGIMEYDTKTYSGQGDENVYYAGELNTSGADSNQIVIMYTNGKGPIHEYMAPYTEFTANYSIDRTLSESPLILVKGIHSYNAYTQTDEIKKMIMAGHIGVFGYHSSGGSSASDNTAKYESVTANHGVALIGWDDSYSKDNFSVKPENDGAWIIRNSWGTNVGEEGYMYISYETEIECVLFFTDADLNDGTQHMYSYDNGYSQYHNMFCTGSATMSNIFTAERDETLTGSSFTIYRSNASVDQDYTVSVYKLNPGYKNPTDGILLTTTDRSNMTYMGTEYVEFKDSVKLTKGDTFSICVNFTGEVIEIPVDTTETYLSYYTSYTVASPGQSYVYYNEHWSDISSDGKSNVRIKAYTSTDTAYEAVLNGTSYEKLSDALEASKDGDTVYLLHNIECGQLTVSKNITLDLRGFDLKIAKSDVSKAAITVSNCDFKLKYGSVTTDGTVLRTTNGSLDIYRILMNENGDGYAVITDCTKATIDALSYGGKDCIDANGGTLSISGSYITCSGTIVRTTGCTASIVSGSYGSDTASLCGDVSIIGGTMRFDPMFDPTPFIYPTSTMSYSFMDDEYTVTAAEVEEYNGCYTLAKAVNNTDGSVIKLTRDTVITSSIWMPSSGAVTIDLNGYDLTYSPKYSSAMFYLMDPLTLTNSSSKVSTIKTSMLYDGSNSSAPKITIGDNISVVLSSTITNSKTDADVTISERSTVTRTISESNEKTVVHYISVDGKVKEYNTVTVTDILGNTVATYSGYRTQTGFADYSYRNGNVFDTNGNVIGTWERDYTMNTTDQSMTTVDRIKYTDGRTEVDYSSKYYGNGMTLFYVVSAKAVSGKDCEISCTLNGESHTENVNYSMMGTCAEKIKKAEDLIKDVGCSSVKKCIRIESILSDNKLLVKDEINGYLSQGYDIQIDHIEYSVRLKAGTGLLTGDTRLTFEKAGYSSMTSAQRSSVGSGTAYSFTATVDGHDAELPCKCVVYVSYIFPQDGTFCSVDGNGSVSRLNTTYDSSICGYAVDVDSACILAYDTHTSPGTGDSFKYTTYIIAGIIVVLALGILVLSRVRKA